MKTKILMRLSALLMGIIGLITSFLPAEILSHYGVHPARGIEFALQILGATYLGFAVLNWTARFNLIGGIYGRPIALANLLHFSVAAITLLKVIIEGHTRAEVVIGAALYSVFAVCFGIVVFTHPTRERSGSIPAESERSSSPPQ